MDPNATWQRLLNALAVGQLVEARDAFTDLTEWLDSGGFLPTYLAEHPDARTAARRGFGSVVRYVADANLV